MKSVCVLLSTYNGGQFLEEQIESLLKQEDINFTILIRDDGSTDETIDILKNYSKKDSRIKYYLGENVGPAQSFFDLIRCSSLTDYYAFCDQDDVWDSDKLKCAIEALEKEDNSQPNMYYSNLRIVDKNLNFYRFSHSSPLTQENPYSALTEDIATGCTVVFNRVAREYAKSSIPEYCSMHDTWIYMICKFFGQCIYDFNAHISYRQHDNNVVGTYLGKKTIKLYKERLIRLFNRQLQPRYNNAKNFYILFKDRLKPEDAEKVQLVASYKNSIFSRLKLLLNKEVYASSTSRDIRFRVLILLGIV